ncbi:MAG: PIN domain-containing protein [Polyangiaceae bacterium]|nr:PIN domain-containing protein [Polyangiaceae bacterium]
MLERELTALIQEGRVVIIGAIRQELLSGVRGEVQFRKLRDRLRAFKDIWLDESDYEEAAKCFNRCRAKGVQGGSIDFLLCAVCLRRKLTVFTTDQDFRHYAKVIGIKLHEARKKLL